MIKAKAKAKKKREREREKYVKKETPAQTHSIDITNPEKAIISYPKNPIRSTSHQKV